MKTLETSGKGLKGLALKKVLPLSHGQDLPGGNAQCAGDWLNQRMSAFKLSHLIFGQLKWRCGSCCPDALREGWWERDPERPHQPGKGHPIGMICSFIRDDVPLWRNGKPRTHCSTCPHRHVHFFFLVLWLRERVVKTIGDICSMRLKRRSSLIQVLACGTGNWGLATSRAQQQ